MSFTYVISLDYLTDELNRMSWVSRSLVNIPIYPTLLAKILICKAITINTFFVLVLFREPGKFTSTWIIVAIWSCTGLVVAVPNLVEGHNPDAYYGNTGFCMLFFLRRNPVNNFTNFVGCFITSNYTTERLMTDYVWAWLTGLAMVILYPIMAVVVCCWARGSVNQTTHITVGKKLLLYTPYSLGCKIMS